MAKPKIVIDPRPHTPKENVRTMSVEEIIESAGADWDPNDPGIGRAVILPDGREVFNPVPMAPPVGYIDQPSIFDQLYAKLRGELLAAKREEEIVDTAEEMHDFPEDDEPTFWTDYELVLRDEAPEMPPPEPGTPGAPLEEEAPAAAGELEDPPPKPRKKKPAVEPAEEAET